MSDEDHRPNFSAQLLSFAPIKCTICGATIRTLPPRLWWSNLLLLVPCATCDDQLMQLYESLRHE